MKKVGKIYSAVDCDELEIGDIVHLTNFPKDAYSDDFELNYIYEDDVYPFFRDGIIFAFAKLICPKKHVNVYKAWKNGAKIAHKIPALRQWYPTDNPSWAEDEEFRIVEPAHDNSELPEGLHLGKQSNERWRDRNE